VGDAGHVHRRLPDDPKVASHDPYWRERGASAGGPFGFVFPPLGPAGAPQTGRERVEAALVAGVERFAAAHCAGRRSAPVDRDSEAFAIGRPALLAKSAV